VKQIQQEQERDQISETGLADVMSDLVTSRGLRVAVLRYVRIVNTRNERTNRDETTIAVCTCRTGGFFLKENYSILGCDFS
jgi:hypothetical protein